MNEVNFLFPSKHNAQLEACETRCDLLNQEVHVMRYVLERVVMESGGDLSRLANDALNFRGRKKSPSEVDGDSGG